MGEVSQGRITEILDAWRQGDERAAERLFPLVYDDLKVLAAAALRPERPDTRASCKSHDVVARFARRWA